MKAILFDLDGTLTDPREGITRSLAQAMQRMGLAPPPVESLTFAIGPPLRAALGVLWGYGSREELEAAGAHALCATPLDLPEALARLASTRVS